MLFKINEKDVSAPFKSTNLFPSVMYILILFIVVLFTGLNVIIRGSMVKE